MKFLRRFCAFFAVFLLFLCGVKLFTNTFFPLKYEEIIEKYAAENGLDKYLVMAVIRAESGFDSDAHSGLARGLMQLTDDTAEWISRRISAEYSEENVAEPDTNIKLGCAYLAYLLGIYQNHETALAAYNAGPGKVGEWLKDERYSHDGEELYEIPYEETKLYVQRVVKFEKIYKKLY